MSNLLFVPLSKAAKMTSAEVYRLVGDPVGAYSCALVQKKETELYVYVAGTNAASFHRALWCSIDMFAGYNFNRLGLLRFFVFGNSVDVAKSHILQLFPGTDDFIEYKENT